MIDVINHVRLLGFFPLFIGIQAQLEVGQCLIGGRSSLPSLLDLQTMTQNPSKICVLFVGGRSTGVDLGSVSLGGGMEVLRFGAVVEGLVFPEAYSSRFILTQRLYQLIDGVLSQI